MAQSSRPALPITVLINGQRNVTLHPLVAQRSCGGKRLDFATLQLHGRIGGLLSGPGDVWEVTLLSEVNQGGRTRDFVYFWGKVSKKRLVIGQNDEFIEYVARLEPWHFGAPLSTYPVFNPANKQFQAIDGPVIFNPQIDGEIWANCHNSKLVPIGTQKVPVFLDPESVRSTGAAGIQAGTTTPWTLSKAVFWACNWLNDQKFVGNPTLPELQAVFDDQRDLLRNLKLRIGLYLPTVLDELLDPLGYQWFVQHKDRKTRKIVVYKRGKGTRRNNVGLQPAGQELDINASNLKEAPGLEIDHAGLVNSVEGLGDWIEIEGTFELYRGWPESQDSLRLQPSRLQKNKNSSNPDAWRRWVLNEAGDYAKLRKKVGKIPEFYDFSSLVDPSFAPPKRRKFLPTLSLKTDGTPAGTIHGTLVEYFHSTAADNGTWKEVPHEFRLLEHECGVEFTGEHVPQEFLQSGDRLKLRITATIRFDQRLRGFAPRRPTSLQPDEKRITLDLHERFHLRKVDKSSIYYSEVTGANPSRISLQVDDSAALQSYCEKIRDVFDFPTVDGPLRLEGIDRIGYQLGDSIDAIIGRGIVLKDSRQKDASGPQVVGITYDFQRQHTTLQLDQYRAEKRFLVDAQGS